MTDVSSDDPKRVTAVDRSGMLNSMPPIIGANARVLVLGSMPGAVSLAEQRYYAHPRNLFWPMMARHLGIPLEWDYADRLRALADSGVALWDVLAQCRRRGSLDGSIARDSEHANDIPALLREAPSIQAVLLNGRRAASAFRRHCEGDCRAVQPSLVTHALPSTSPANQSIPLARRQASWAVIADYALAPSAVGS